MRILILMTVLYSIGCATQQVPAKKVRRVPLRNFSVENGYCPDNHHMINLPRNNGYALDPVFNPEAYHKTSIENLK